VGEARLEDFRFHDLRHTAASHLVMRGALLADVRVVLGHADIKMTMRCAQPEPGAPALRRRAPRRPRGRAGGGPLSLPDPGGSL
jgi:integrase